MMDGPRGQNVLMIPFFLPSHVNALLHIARILASQGCNITFIKPNKDFENGQEEGIHFVSITESNISDTCATGSKGNSGVAQIMGAMLGMQPAFEELLQQINNSDNPIHYIISDLIVTWMPSTAHKFNLPCSQLWAGSAASLLIMLRIPQIMTKVRFPITADDLKKNEGPIECTEGILPLCLHDIPFTYHGDPPYPGYYEEIYANTRKAFEAEWVLVNTFEDLEKDVLLSFRAEVQNLLPVGPLLARQNTPSNYEEEASKCMEWLENQADNSVLYVAFGTVADLSEDKVQGLAAELELSGQPFLLVLGQNMTKSTQKKTKDALMKGMVVEWAPQQLVLHHKAIGGFLTHCGWNSLLEGVAAGVPMLGWPCLFEQNLNCKYMVDEWRIGLKVGMGSEGEFEVGNIAHGIRSLFFEEEGGCCFRRWISSTASEIHGNSKSEAVMCTPGYLAEECSWLSFGFCSSNSRF